jgi:hypothetical protein
LITDIINFQKGEAAVANSPLGIIITLIGLPVYFLQKEK